MSRTDCNCAALRQAARRVTRIYDEALAPAGLGVNQFSVLARLEQYGPLQLNELAAHLVMDRSTAGHLLRPLASRGLVAIAVRPADGRCRVVSLTGMGRALLVEARPLWAAAQARFEQAFGSDRAAAMRNTLWDVLEAPFGGAAPMLNRDPQETAHAR